MKKCIVIGGGFAGLAAASYLVNSNFYVELIEASPKLGGRAYSFLHKDTATLLDNGQHIMMGCYNDTLKFFSLIGSIHKVQVQKKMSVKFLKQGFELHELKATLSPYPFNLLSAILRYKAITLAERLSALRLFVKLPFLSNRALEKMSVKEFLITEKQDENVIKSLWEIITVGALNTNVNKASAKMFVDILKEIFLRGGNGSKIVLPKVGLSEMFCDPAKAFIEEKGGKICLSEKVENIKVEKKRVLEVRTDKRTITDFDFVISAVPHFAIERILKSSVNDGKSELFSQSLLTSQKAGMHSPNESLRTTIQPLNPQYSSILNVHIWLKEKKYGNEFFALIDSKLHWVFSYDTHLTCVISDADYLMKLPDESIMDIIYSELEKYLNLLRYEIADYFIMKEKRATFIVDNRIINSRPKTETEIKNLHLAGDWVKTGLPSTIESAVMSGRRAAQMTVSHT